LSGILKGNTHWGKQWVVHFGLTWGDLRSHALAIAYPLVVLGIAAAIATLLGAIDTNSTDWNKTFTNIGLMSSTGVLMVMITEEGFFRGWLWASLKKTGRSDKVVRLWTTFAFIVWHISAISLDTGFDLPAKEIPIYLINGTILGLV
jgi:membrane protease YdiL (CAAX protease family)